MPIIQSIDRALKILDLFDDRTRELSITDISKKMNLHKSTVHSLLKTLQSHRYIAQSEENGKYMLGLKLFERGNLVVSNLDLRSVARKHLENLSETTSLTVHLVILDGKEGVYIDKVEGSGVTVFYSRIGRRVPIHTSAVGKALVAFKSDEELKKLLKNYKFKKQTDNSIGSAKEFYEEINNIRERGFSIDNEENEAGIVCVSVPIKDYSGKTIAAISMSTPASSATDEKIAHHVSLLKDCTDKISRELGFEYEKI
ncbi:IclR family transcriptional regulator [Halobacillus massiliensis]|uniref:IclR family transcriptional regulator n=1 Tax=Halobacillus massiliensis TaxID=1926286 RepID=UPI0009E55BD2|nr:IclR family transcriptional regulator [Halobacillus massiliensis]